jgi:alpha-1,3-rhamnosyl/mannosyltransferase
VLYDTIPLQHEPNPLRRRVLRGVFLRAAHLSTRVLTISEHSARGLVRELGLAPDRIGVLPIPFDRRLVDRIEGARSAGLSADPSVLFVGRMTPHKNLERLVRAFSRSHTHRIGGRLVLAGESGAAAAHLRRLGHELGVRVDTPGALSEDDLVREYARSWAVALVSLDEGLGLPVLEATAAGIPVVASNAGGIMETVGERLPLVDPLDELAIARGIDQAVGCEGRISSNLVAWTRTMPEASDLAAAVVREVDCLRRPPG